MIPSPAVNLWRGFRRRIGMRGAWLVAALLVVGLSLTAVVVRAVKAGETADAARDFDFACREIQTRIEQRLHEHEQILRSGAAFFADVDGVTREEWHAYAERQKVNQTLPGIQGIGFSLLVPRERLAEHQRQIRAEGFPDYRVWPEGERETYSTIVFLEPFVGRNLRAFGYDMFSEVTRRAAMERARDQDKASLSAKVVLVQETGQDFQPGTLMFVPVYCIGMAHATVSERRAAIMGWVYSPYRMTDLMQGVLPSQLLMESGDIQLTVFDGTKPSPSALLYDSARRAARQPPVNLTRQTIVDSSGRPWLLHFGQIGAPGTSASTSKIGWVWASGSTISLLVAGLALSLISTRNHARVLARNLTADLRHSEERWKFALEGAGDGVWDWNVTTDELYFSKRCTAQLGFAEHEFGTTSKAWLQLLHPEDVAQAVVKVQAHLDNQSVPYLNEFRVQCKDGTWKWLLDRGMVVSRDAEGHALRMIGTHKDVTVRKQSEAELARYATIEHALMLLATKFVNVPREQEEAAIDELLATMGRLIDADLVHVFTYDFANGLGSNTYEWFGAGIQPQAHKLQSMPIALYPDLVAAHQRGEPWHVPSVADLPAASPLRQVLDSLGVRSLVTLPLMHDGECLGFVVFDAIREQRVWQAADIALLGVLAELYSNFAARRAADRQALELQLGITAARDEAQAAAHAKSLFLANMSHEIRTPLNAILGYVQIMERENRDRPDQPGPNGERLNAIHRSGQHLLALLNDLLELVRSDARAIIPEPTEFDFHQVLEDVRLMFVPSLEARAISLDISCAPDVPRLLHADPVKVRQVLVNLVSNALKFTTTGAVHLRAGLASGRVADGYLLAVDVEDSGCGIAADELEHIFEVFGQAEHGRKSGKGTGLGLPLSRRYARALGGEVAAIRSSAAGSHFRFTFQARAASRPVPGRMDEARGWPLTAPLPPAAGGLDPAAMAQLAAEQRLRLEQALRGGDINGLRELIAEITREYPALAGGLRVLLESYDYERLRKLLEAARTL